MSDLEIEPLAEGLSFGARITRITRDNVREPAIRDQVARQLEQSGVLVFSGIEQTSEMQVALSSIFGPLRNHAMPDSPRADVGASATLMELHNDPAGQNVFEIDGRLVAGCTPWHWDACYAPKIYRGGVLRALEMSADGGETGFADGIQLCRSISVELREQFEQLEIVYDPGLMHDRQKFGLPDDYRFVETSPVMRQVMAAYVGAPRAIHPAIWKRQTGEPVLHVSPWQAAGIAGRENAQGDALLERLCREMLAGMEAYWHRWRADEMLAWDNWRMIHAVNGHDPAQSRKVHRATIEGDYGLGRAEPKVIEAPA